jgi:hypothetical protein
MQRLEEEGFFDFEQMEEIAETYMRMLVEIQFHKDLSKYFECVICLKEFEESERVF